MAPIYTIPTTLDKAITIRKVTKQIVLFWFMFSLLACSQTGQPSSGDQKKLRISVGEIKDLSLSSRGDGSSELIGTSDNQEVVDVSRQQLAPAVDTLNRNNTGPTIFQIKGITAGTANVVFSKKPSGGTGPGEVVRTYVVQVTAK